MIAGLVICFVYAVVVWLVFFYFKWIKFSIAWGVVSVLFGLHLLIIFMIGLRFVAPLSTEAKLVQHTIQLTPRLSEPTLVTDVLVAHNQHVKAGAPLFQFDRRPYEYKVRNLEAQLAKAKQDVLIDEADVAISVHKLAKLKDELVYTQYQSQLSANLAKQGAGPKEDAQKWAAQVAAGEAGILEAQADEQRARLRFTSDIDGVNTSVATIQAELALARFYLDNTIMLAPGGRLHHEPAGAPRHGGRRRALRRHRLPHLRRRPLSGGPILPGEPQIREARATGRSRPGPLSGPDLAGHRRGHLAG